MSHPPVSRFGPAVRRWASMRTDVGSSRLRLYCPPRNSETHCRLSTLPVQRLCAIAYINICAHVKHPILHTLIGMGSAALAAAVAYPGIVTQISCKGQTAKIKKIKNKTLKQTV